MALVMIGGCVICGNSSNQTITIKFIQLHPKVILNFLSNNFYKKYFCLLLRDRLVMFALKRMKISAPLNLTCQNIMALLLGVY